MTSVSIPVYNKKNHTVGATPFSSSLSTVSQTALFSSIFLFYAIPCYFILLSQTIYFEFFIFLLICPKSSCVSIFRFSSFPLNLILAVILSLLQLLHFADSFFLNFNPVSGIPTIMVSAQPFYCTYFFNFITSYESYFWLLLYIWIWIFLLHFKLVMLFRYFLYICLYQRYPSTFLYWILYINIQYFWTPHTKRSWSTEINIRCYKNLPVWKFFLFLSKLIQKIFSVLMTFDHRSV